MAFTLDPFVSSLVSGTYKGPVAKPALDPFMTSLISRTYKAPVATTKAPTTPVATTKAPTTPVATTKAPTTPASTYSQIPQQEIDDLYNPSYSRLGDIERGVRAGEQDFYSQQTDPYEQLRPQLASSFEEGKILGRQQTGEVEASRENALADARRLYNELFAGSQQRFGGSSSAGEFANAYLGRELQRQMGGIQNTTAQNLQKIATGQETLQREFHSKSQQLDQQKASALVQAKNIFQDRLNEINNTRFGLDQNKIAAKLQTLREHVARVNNLQDYFTQQDVQLKNSLALAGQQARLTADLYKQGAGTPTNLTPLQQIFSALGQPSGTPQPIPQGQIGPLYRFDPQTGQYIKVQG